MSKKKTKTSTKKSNIRPSFLFINCPPFCSLLYFIIWGGVYVYVVTMINDFLYELKRVNVFDCDCRWQKASSTEKMNALSNKNQCLPDCLTACLPGTSICRFYNNSSFFSFYFVHWVDSMLYSTHPLKFWIRLKWSVCRFYFIYLFVLWFECPSECPMEEWQKKTKKKETRCLFMWKIKFEVKYWSKV